MNLCIKYILIYLLSNNQFFTPPFVAEKMCSRMCRRLKDYYFAETRKITKTLKVQTRQSNILIREPEGENKNLITWFYNYSRLYLTLKLIFSLVCVLVSDGHGKKNNSRPTTASGKNPQPTTVWRRFWRRHYNCLLLEKISSLFSANIWQNYKEPLNFKPIYMIFFILFFMIWVCHSYI